MRASLVVAVCSLCACQEYNLQIDKDDDPDVLLDSDDGLGIGVPDLLVEPLTIEFGEVPPGCEAVPVNITLANVGDAPLRVFGLDLNGADRVAVTLSRQGRINLAPGQSEVVQVTFRPEEARVYDDIEIVVASDDPDEEFVSVTAEGEARLGALREELWIIDAVDALDVLWVIDNSESMSDNIDALAAGMSEFINDFVTRGIDFHLGVTTTDMESGGAQGALLGAYLTPGTLNPGDVFRSQTSSGIAGSTTEKGFAAARAALTAPRITSGFNNGFLRPDARLAIIAVSDEDDGEANPEGAGLFVRPQVTNNFVSWLEGLKADPDEASFSAFVGPASAGLAACGLLSGTQATSAPQYNRAIRNTGGVWGNICDFDIPAFLDDLVAATTAPDRRFQLQATPASVDCDDIVVTVDGVEVPCNDEVNGWTWDEATQTIELHGDAVPEPGEVVVIAYPSDEACTVP